MIRSASALSNSPFAVSTASLAFLTSVSLGIRAEISVILLFRDILLTESVRSFDARTSGVVKRSTGVKDVLNSSNQFVGLNFTGYT